MTDIRYELNLTPKQWEAMSKLYDDKTTFVLFGGGRGGGKSWLGWEWLLTMGITHPDTRWFVARNELKRFMTTTYVTFLKVCKSHGIPPSMWSLNSQHNYIKLSNGTRYDIIDVAYQPSDTMYERFGSTEYTGGWLEEVGEIREKAFDMLKSSVGRHMNKEYSIKPKIFMTCNPKKHWAYNYFYKPWRDGTLPEDSCFIQSLYSDNPHTSSEYGEMLRKIRDPIMRDRLMNGNWEYDDTEGNLIRYDNILAMFNKDPVFNQDDVMYFTGDAALFGRDKAVMMLWQGWHIKKVWYYNKSSSKFQREKTERILQQYRVSVQNSVYDDGGGYGSGILDYIPGMNRFNASSSPMEAYDENFEDIEKYTFLNLRSQCYHFIADKINKGEITIDINGIEIPDDDKATVSPFDVRNWIIEELEAIRRKDYEKDEKKLAIISKEDMKGLIGRSPDFGDCMMMRGIFSLQMPAGKVELLW